MLYIWGPVLQTTPNPVIEHRWQITIPKANTPLRHSVYERENFASFPIDIILYVMGIPPPTHVFGAIS